MAGLEPVYVGDEYPMQPIGVDKHGVARFLENRIVRDLIDFTAPLGFDHNHIARGNYSREERNQFAQLIGYSVCGYGDLSYSFPHEVYRADLIVDEIAKNFDFSSGQPFDDDE